MLSRSVIQGLLRGEKIALPPVRDLEEQGIAPLLYARTRDPALRDIAIRAAAIEPVLAAELRTVTDALHEAGVLTIILKGSALAYDIYPAPELRPRSDTDLLVDAAQMTDLDRVLTGLGYYSSTTSGDELGVRQRNWTRSVHMLDVHWEATNTALAADIIRMHEVEPLPLPRLGPHALGLPHVEALLLACVHRVAHHYDDERLIWLYDIHLLRAELTREEHARFWRLAAERDVLTICRRSVELAEEWFGASHDGVEEFISHARLVRAEASAKLLDRSQSQGALKFAELRALPDWPTRFRRARQLAFPPRAFMESQFGVRSPLLLAWLYAYRGVRGLRRLLRKNA
jgi:hypothetical protein